MSDQIVDMLEAVQRPQIARLQAENERLRAALEAINALRDEIIRTQTIGWSRTIYPLVKILDEAGIASTVTDAELGIKPVTMNAEAVPDDH